MKLFEDKKGKEKKKRDVRAWFILSTTFAFMLGVFAPLEAYYSNKNEFWFNIWQVMGIALLVFIVSEIILIVTSFFLCNSKISLYCYIFLTFLMVYLYIQGNFIPRNYGVLNGVDIHWDQYTQYGAASVALASICLVLVGIVIVKFKKNAFKLGSYLSIFIFSIQIVTLLTFVIRDVINTTENSYKSKVVTDNKLFELSENNNIIVFILDTFDGEYFNYLLDSDYDTYSDILKDFTYYKDTAGAYPTTKGALPNILTGVWYENEQPYDSYVENAYVDNDIYKSFSENNYSVGIYTYETFLGSDIRNYENVELGTYKISNKFDFINSLYKMVAFNYVPHQCKQWFFYESSEFEALKRSAVGHPAYSLDVQKFADKLNKEGITVSKKENCFRLYHLEGVHPPYTFGKDLISDVSMEYSSYDEAAGNCMLIKRYLSELKDMGVYDNTSIVIMADHGDAEYSQNPIFLIKNRDEVHDFRVSDVPMSYEYLSSIWIAFINGDRVDETFIGSCKKEGQGRRFLHYAWDDSWDRDYLPTISEAFVRGIASDAKNIIFSGAQYEPAMQDYPYTLGTELSFASESAVNAKTYCHSGFYIPGELGTWTAGTKSVMSFDIEEERYNNLLLTIESGIFGSQQEVLIYANDYQVADVKFYELERKEIVIPNEYVKNGLLRITMKYPNAVIPHDIDENSEEWRQLALNMRSIKLESTDKEFNLGDQQVGRYELGTVLTFSDAKNTAKDYCVNGFSRAEDTGTWTDSNTMNMSFSISNEEIADIVLEYTCVPFNGNQHVILYANDQKIADYNQMAEESKEITLSAEYIQDGELNLRFELPDAKSPKEVGLSEDARTLGLFMKELSIRQGHSDVIDQVTEKYELGTVLIFSNTINTAKNYCLNGFSEAEDVFTWTDSSTANMAFLISDEELSDMLLEYTCAPFNGNQHVILYANDQKIADYNLTIEETKEITIPAECVKGRELQLRFELPDAKSPKELGMSEDARTLGLAMKKLSVKILE